MKKILTSITVAISTILLFGGCASGGGKKAAVENNSGSATLGQQLLDLKAAYKSKAISKKEYNEEKKRLLKDY